MKTRFILSLVCSIALCATTLSLVALVPNIAPAQEAPERETLATREQRVDAELALWRDSLHLTEAQAARIRELMLQQDDEATRDRAVLESWLASHPDATEEQEAALQQRYASHMLAYDPLYDAYLDPWQRDIVIRIDLYHEHRRFLRGLWWRWWWWPWRIGPVWPPHHHGPHWPRPYPPHHPPAPPPIPPRPSRPHEPGPRTMPPPRSNPPERSYPPQSNPQPQRPEQQRTPPPPRQPAERTQPPPRQQPTQQPRNEAPRQQPSSGQQPTQRPQRPGR